MRKKGSRNKGFWFRKGRGWYVGNDKLPNADGQHIKGVDDRQAAEQAYHTLMSRGKPEPKAKQWLDAHYWYGCRRMAY